MSISNKINNIPNENSLTSNNINQISPINLNANNIKQDILFFKNDILKDIRTIEEKLYLKIKEQKIENAQQYGKYDKKIDNISNKLSRINTLLSSNKDASEKIALFESFKIKTEDSLYAINSKLNSIQRESKDFYYKYEKIINDNLQYPGLLGNNSKFPSLKFFIDFVLNNIKSLNEFKEEIKRIDIKEFKKKVNIEMKNLKFDMDNNYKNSKNIIEKNIKETDTKLESYSSNLDKKFEEYYEKIEKIQNEIKEKINNIHDDLNDKYNKQTKEIENIKDNQKKYFKINNIEKYNKIHEKGTKRRRSIKFSTVKYKLGKKILDNKEINREIIDYNFKSVENDNKIDKIKKDNIITEEEINKNSIIKESNNNNIIKEININIIDKENNINNINIEKNINNMIKDSNIDNFNHIKNNISKDNIKSNQNDFILFKKIINKNNEEIKDNSKDIINLNYKNQEKIQEKNKIKSYLKIKSNENKILDLIKNDIKDNSILNNNNTENSNNNNFSKYKFINIPLTSREPFYNKISKNTKRNNFKKISNEDKQKKEEYHSFDYYEQNKYLANKQDKPIEFNKNTKLKFHVFQKSSKLFFPNNYSITNIPKIQFNKVVLPSPSSITNNNDPLFKTSLSDNNFKTLKDKNLLDKNMNMNKNLNKIKKIKPCKFRNKKNNISPKESKFDNITKNSEQLLSNINFTKCINDNKYLKSYDNKDKSVNLSYDKLDKGVITNFFPKNKNNILK